MNKAPLVSYTNEEEQARLTLAGRFVTGSRVLSNETVALMLRNENQNGISELMDMVVRLGRVQTLALAASAEIGGVSMPIPSELAKRWEERWKTVYSVKADFAAMPIPKPPTLFRARFVAMHERGNSSELLYRANEKLMTGVCHHWKFCGDQSLDEAVPKHNFTGTFGCWVADSDEAPFGNLGGINLNTNVVRELREFGVLTTTLPVRLVLGADVFLESDSKKQLDRTVVTMCAESETADGRVPRVGFGSRYGEVCVDGWGLAGADDGIRFRRAVYLKP